MKRLLATRFAVWIVSAIALLSFAAGSGLVTLVAQEKKGNADRVFELNVYHAVRGKAPALEARFRDASKLLARHKIDVIGYWVPNDDPAFADTFIYIVAAPNRKELEKNWDAFHADPAFQKYRKAERAEKLIEKVDSTCMRPTDFSALK